MAQESRFWDKLADRYHSQPIADEAAYAKKLAVTRSYLRPDMDVFEFGCGTGGTAVEHAPHVRHIDAVDFSQRMVEIARARARAADVPNVTFAQGDIADFAAPAQRYDMVLGLSILHLLADPRAAVTKAHSLLKPGGVFVSSTACLGDTMAFIKYVAPLGRALGKLPLLSVFSGAELVAMLQDAGFSIEHRYQPGRGKALFLVARKAG